MLLCAVAGSEVDCQLATASAVALDWARAMPRLLRAICEPGFSEALWQMAESYHRVGDKFEDQQATAYQRIVKDYPLSVHAEDARAQLEVMKRTVPEADTVAMARMKYEMENHTK